MQFLSHIGQTTLRFFQLIGEFSCFLAKTISAGFTYPWYPLLILRQCMNIGFYSLPVVGMTALFSGMVLALQSYTGFSRFQAEGAIATVVVLSMTRELGPVLAGLMVAGRVGASIAAEIATMRVTEQIDALTTLSTNPFKYLIFPRFFAGLITLPILVLIADSIGVLGGYFVSIYYLNFNKSVYLSQTLHYLEFADVLSGLIKAMVFGGIITIMGCYHGYNSTKGAEGVGKATTQAVVTASIFILIFNYILTALLFTK